MSFDWAEIYKEITGNDLVYIKIDDLPRDDETVQALLYYGGYYDDN